MRMHKVLIGTAIACLAVVGMLGTKSASANDHPLTVTPAVYTPNDSDEGGAQTQLVRWRRGWGGGYGWRGGYGWGGYRGGWGGGYYRPYYGYRSFYGPGVYRPYYGGFGYGYPGYGYGYGYPYGGGVGVGIW